MLMTVQTPQRRTVVLPSQVIKPSILVLPIEVEDVQGINITSSSNSLTINGDITVNSSVTGAVGLNINNGGSNNVINMTGDISTISTGGAVTMHGIRIGTNQSSNTINVTGNVSTTGNNSSGILIIEGGDNNNVTLFGNINTSGGDSANGVRITGQIRATLASITTSRSMAILAQSLPMLLR